MEKQNVPVPDPSALTNEALRRDIAALRELIETRLRGDERLQGERFQSAKESVAKAETNTTKQIDSIMALISATTKAYDDKIAEVKERLDRGDGQSGGKRELTISQHRSLNTVISVIGALIAIAALVLSIILATQGMK